MDATQITTSSTHPLVLVAAASVTVLSLAGVSALAGWLPGPGSHVVEPIRMASAAPVAPATATVSIEHAATVPQAKPATKLNVRTPASIRRAEPPPTMSAPPFAASSAPTYAASAPPICHDCGVVQAVNEVAVEAKGNGGGAVTGGVVGGIIGNQFGKGATRDIATILGVVGGAYAGNHIEKSVKESKRYDVVVRFEDGSTRTFSNDSAPVWQSGDHVRLQNGLLTMGGGRSYGNGTI